VSFAGKIPQISAKGYRCHDIHVRVRIHGHIGGFPAISHRPRKRADDDQQDTLKELKRAA